MKIIGVLEQIFQLPLQLQAHIFQESDRSLHSGAHHVRPIH